MLPGVTLGTTLLVDTENSRENRPSIGTACLAGAACVRVVSAGERCARLVSGCDARGGEEEPPSSSSPFAMRATQAVGAAPTTASVSRRGERKRCGEMPRSEIERPIEHDKSAASSQLKQTNAQQTNAQQTNARHTKTRHTQTRQTTRADNRSSPMFHSLRLPQADSPTPPLLTPRGGGRHWRLGSRWVVRRRRTWRRV